MAVVKPVFVKVVLALLVASVAGIVIAQSLAPNAPVNTADPNATGHSGVNARIEQSFPGARVTSVKPAPLAGLLEVTLNGTEVVYASTDGRYLLSGELYELRDNGPVSLQEERLERVRTQSLGGIDKEGLITFAAEKQQAEVYVFTDISCGYCRRLHQQMAQYNAKGITVHYLAYPRQGMDSPSAATMRAVWCAKDRQSAMTEAKLSGVGATPPADCDDPVAEQLLLGATFGVRGTPAVFTREGAQLGGYVPPEELAKSLGLK